MRRVVVTGANGAGKSTLAAALSDARPDLPLVRYDALKLTTGWEQRDRSEIDALLRQQVHEPAWILEGGPSLLPVALPRAEVVIWLDPPTWLRAWRLARRPWTSLGRTRAELPDGNPDRLWQQYRFAVRSLAMTRSFRATIASTTATSAATQMWRCRTPAEARAALARLAADPDGPTPPSRPPSARR